MEENSVKKLYMIGDKESGILFVRTDPVRIVHIPLSSITEYATNHRTTVDAVFAEIGAASKQVVDTVASATGPDELYSFLEAMLKGGTTITDAAFCFISDIEGDGFDVSRYSVMPIGVSASELASGSASETLITSEVGGGS